MISVVIPFLNEAENLPNCLGAFYRQTFKGPFELILVDNGSRDQSREVVREFKSRGQFPLRMIVESRRGVGHARNLGFHAARFPIIASTDADTVVDANWLERIGDAFNHVGVVSVAGLTRFEALPFLTVWQSAWLGLNALATCPMGWGHNFAIRREIFDRVGGFRMERQSEDMELSFRVRRSLRDGEHMRFDPFMRVTTSGRRYRRGRGATRYLWRGTLDYFSILTGINLNGHKSQLPQYDREIS